MTEWIGRWHPLLVHLPIGILLLAAVFEWLSYYKPYRKFRAGIRAMLLFGAIASTLSVVTGLSLASSGAYDARLVELHKNTGIVTTIFAWIVFFARDSIVTIFQQKKKKKLVRIFLFIPLAALVGLTGHFGGSLTHGEDYLTGGSATEAPRPIRLTWKGDPDSARVYQDIIVPILDSRCYGCHGPTKQKGKLRLDQPSFISQGGKDGDIIKGTPPDSSVIYKRLMLPLEDEHHMPPNEKPQLTSAEAALIHAWLAAGAPFDGRISQMNNAADLKRYLLSLTSTSVQKRLLPESVTVAAEPSAVAALIKLGVLVVPVSDSTNYLSVSYLNAHSVTDSQLSLLLPLREQLLWLDLAHTAVGDGAMQVIGKLNKLTQLNLQHTEIQDTSLKGIEALAHLQTINLVGTKITDASLPDLSRIKSLERVYCYGTAVTKSGVENLLRVRPKLVIDTGGYELPARITDTLEYKAVKKK